MFFYRKFLETVAAHGIIDATMTPLPMAAATLKEIITSKEPKIFVFSQVPKHWKSVGIAGDKTKESNFIKEKMEEKYGAHDIALYADVKLSVPFQHTWYECLWDDGKLCTMYPFIDQPERKMHVYGVLVQEQSPGQFWYYLLMGREEKYLVICYLEGLDEVGLIGIHESTGEISQTFPKHYNEDAEAFRLTAVDCVHNLLEELGKSAGGMVTVNEKFKIKVRGENLFPKIRKIVYVVPKAAKGNPIPGVHRTIDWSHRWLVRAHWRRINGIGKDRDGNYSMRGFTWVVEHEKGAEDAPLIADKVRLVKG